MKKLVLLFTMSFLSASEAFDVAEDTTPVTQSVKSVVGEVYLHSGLLYSGSDTQYYKDAFNMDVRPQDLLVQVTIGLKDCTSSDLYKRHKEFDKQFTHKFKNYLPFKLFKDKKESDIIPLSFYGKSVQLICATDDEGFAKKYKNLLLTVFEHQNSQLCDRNLLMEKNILNRVGEVSYFHGLEGYKSLLEYASINSLPALTAICIKMHKERLSIIKNLTNPTFSKAYLHENRPLIEESLAVAENIIQCLQMIMDKMEALDAIEANQN